MQTFLKVLGFITIFIGLITGIYIIFDALNVYAAARNTNDPYLEQVYLIKFFVGGVIMLSSIVSGMLYLSFGIVIELLDRINQRIITFMDALYKKNEKKEDEF